MGAFFRVFIPSARESKGFSAVLQLRLCLTHKMHLNAFPLQNRNLKHYSQKMV